MNVMRKVTLATLRLNRRRTIVTIIGTAIAIAMVTAIATLAASFLQMGHDAAVLETGNWHVAYININEKGVDMLQQDANNESILVSRYEGFAQLPGQEDYTRKTFNLVGYTPQSYPGLNIQLSEGSLPAAPGEILLSDDFREHGGQNWQVGDTVSLDFGYYWEEPRYGDAEQHTEIRSVDYSHYSMNWQSEGPRSFTIAGYANLGYLEQGWHDAYTAIGYLDIAALPAEKCDLTAWVCLGKVPGDIYDQGYAMQKAMCDVTGNNAMGNAGVGVNFNSSLIGFEGSFSSASVFESLLGFFIILFAIVLLGSVSLISNAFSISLAERVRALGMLAGVGATRRQKRSSVLWEAAFIGVFSIPLGIIAGIIGIGITLGFMGGSIGELMDSGAPMRLVVPLWVIIFTILFSIFILLLSAWGPARRASKIAPVEAMRSGGAKVRPRKIRVSRLTRRLFGYEAELGIKNSKRSRRRYLAILSSLVISVVLFLTVSAAMQYLRESLGLVGGNTSPYDVTTSLYPYAETIDGSAAAASYVQAVRAIPETQSAELFTSYYANAQLTDAQLTKEGQEELAANEMEGTYHFYILLYALDDESWQRWCADAGLDAGALDGRRLSGVMIPATNKRTSTGGFTIDPYINYTQGDTVPISVDYTDGHTLATEGAELKIAAVSSTPPPFVDSMVSSNAMVFVTTLENAQQHLPAGYLQDNQWYSVMAKTSQPDALYTKLEELPPDDTLARNVFNMHNSNRRAANGIAILQVFTYGFVILITLVCAANIFNTISTGILLRSREFAMLRSTGLTAKGFNKMMDYETLFYGIKALCWGIPLSVLFSVLLFRSINGGFGFFFSLPLVAYGIAVLGVFMLVGASMLYARSKVRRLNIAETLKQENW